MLAEAARLRALSEKIDQLIASVALEPNAPAYIKALAAGDDAEAERLWVQAQLVKAKKTEAKREIFIRGGNWSRMVRDIAKYADAEGKLGVTKMVSNGIVLVVV